MTHRLSTCYRHPSKPITGFCASCLRERLAGIDSETHQEIPSGSQRSTSELRRSKSFSGAKKEALLNLSEQRRRKSCDVGARNSLYELFNLDDGRKGLNKRFDVEFGNLGFELREVAENEEQREIRVSEKVNEVGLEETDDFVGEEVDLRTMKEFIDLELKRKKSTVGFWEAASVFKKKLRKWRKKQKLKKLGIVSNGVVLENLEAEKKRSLRGLRETQSEIGDYGLGRRSCDTDPRRISMDVGQVSLHDSRYAIDMGRMSLDDSRFSLDEPKISVDLGRMSLDESRYSIHEHRASWDGYLIGKAYPRIKPVLGEMKVPSIGLENKVMDEGEKSPGGSAQTKDYYMDTTSSVRRRKSFDRSNSHRKMTISEVDELKLISNAKVSPASTELFYGGKVLITEKDSNSDSNSKSTNDNNLNVIGSNSKLVVNESSGIDQTRLKKAQGWRKMWKVFGLMQKRSERKCENQEENFVIENVGHGHRFGSVSQKLIRSYSVSCREDPCKMSGFSGVETNKGNGLRKREEMILLRNQSVGYSPDNGLLRFYLTPLRSYRRSKSGKSRLKYHHPHCIAKNVL